MNEPDRKKPDQPFLPMRETVRPKSISVSRWDWEKMHHEVDVLAPEEACGLLAGKIDGDIYQTCLVLPITNYLHSPVCFQLDPQEQLDAFNDIEDQQLELVGIYHSHPNGPDGPSPSDITEAYYPEAVHLIWSCRTGEWQAQAFLIQEGQIFPVILHVHD